MEPKEQPTEPGYYWATRILTNERIPVWVRREAVWGNEMRVAVFGYAELEPIEWYANFLPLAEKAP